MHKMTTTRVVNGGMQQCSNKETAVAYQLRIWQSNLSRHCPHRLPRLKLYEALYPSSVLITMVTEVPTHTLSTDTCKEKPTVLNLLSNQILRYELVSGCFIVPLYTSMHQLKFRPHFGLSLYAFYTTFRQLHVYSRRRLVSRESNDANQQRWNTQYDRRKTRSGGKGP